MVEGIKRWWREVRRQIQWCGIDDANRKEVQQKVEDLIRHGGAAWVLAEVEGIRRRAEVMLTPEVVETLAKEVWDGELARIRNYRMGHEDPGVNEASREKVLNRMISQEEAAATWGPGWEQEWASRMHKMFTRLREYQVEQKNEREKQTMSTEEIGELRHFVIEQDASILTPDPMSQGPAARRGIPFSTEPLRSNPPGLTLADLDEIFQYHAPTSSQQVSYTVLRSAGKALAQAILEVVPAGPDQTAAIRQVREAVMTGNAGIALDGKY